MFELNIQGCGLQILLGSVLQGSEFSHGGGGVTSENIRVGEAVNHQKKMATKNKMMIKVAIKKIPV